MSKKTEEAPPVMGSLRSLARDGEMEGLTRGETFRIDPKLINIQKGFNLRTEGPDLDQHIEHLYLAMKAGAFIPPVDVQVVNGKVVARDGHCRQRAAIRLRKEIPEYTLECRQLRGNEVDAVIHMLGTGTGSKPLTPLEQGRGFLRLIKMGLTSPQIAEKLGVSRVTVDNGLALAEAPVEVQEAIARGEVSSTAAREALKGGQEGVKALISAVETERAKPVAPAPEKDGKPAARKATKPAKKKVTAKTLKGTAADKATRKPKKEAAPMLPPPLPAAAGENELVLTVKRDEAADTLTFLKSFMGKDEKLNAFASCLEIALM